MRLIQGLAVALDADGQGDGGEKRDLAELQSDIVEAIPFECGRWPAIRL
jgi:hypothetical protein